MLQAHNVPVSKDQPPPSKVSSKIAITITTCENVLLVLKTPGTFFFIFLLDERTTTNITNILPTDCHKYTRKETKRSGNSSYWSGMYDASIFLAIVAAVLFALYLVLTLYSKKQFVTQSMHTNNMLCGNSLY